MAEESSWVPLPSCSPPRHPFPIKSLALSACVCLWIIHFWVSDKSPLSIQEEGSVSRSVMSDSLRPHGLQPTRLLCPWDFLGKDTGVGCHFILQGIFPTQGWNPGLLHCRQILYRLRYKGSPSILEGAPLSATAPLRKAFNKTNRRELTVLLILGWMTLPHALLSFTSFCESCGEHCWLCSPKPCSPSFIITEIFL